MKPVLMFDRAEFYVVGGDQPAYIVDIKTEGGGWSSYVVQSGQTAKIIAHVAASRAISFSVRPLDKPPLWSRLVGKLARWHS